MQNRLRTHILRWDKEHKLDWVPDVFYLRPKYRLCLYKRLNLGNPLTYNKKLQWIKLYDRKPQYTMMVDKHAVRSHVAKLIGEEHLIPLLGLWSRVEDIDLGTLPCQFVLKCTHDSGGVVICKKLK